MKKPSAFARMTEMVSLASENAKPPEERQAHEVVTENVIAIDPAKTRMNDLHRRLGKTIDSAALDELAEQIRETGQLLPARGWRPVDPDPSGADVILIFGARRRAACLRLGIALNVEIVPPPSRQALIRQMHSENSSRRDYLPLEQGLEFKAFMDTGEFKTQEELAHFLAVQRVRLVRCLQIADLPTEVLAAYVDPTLLTLAVGTKLAAEIEKSPATKRRVTEAAQQWTRQGGQGDPSSVLLAAAEDRKKVRAVEQDLVSLDKKTRFGRLKTTAEGAVVLQLRSSAPEDLKNELMDVLRRHTKDLR